jgi:hypothetical protein
MPPPAAISPHAAVSQAGPNPMYQPLSHREGVGRCDWLLVWVVSTFART